MSVTTVITIVSGESATIVITEASPANVSIPALTPAAIQFQSSQGPLGPQGPAGADGVDGVDGSDGADGTPGAQGDPGPPGEDGVEGPQGDPGPAGATGATGATGPAGPAGADGADGDSGIVTATAPLQYNSGTKNIAIDPASASQPGYVTIVDQEFAGAKGFMRALFGETSNRAMLVDTGGTNIEAWLLGGTSGQCFEIGAIIDPSGNKTTASQIVGTGLTLLFGNNGGLWADLLMGFHIDGKALLDAGFNGFKGVGLPTGTTAQRPTEDAMKYPTNGAGGNKVLFVIRYNTQTGKGEMYDVNTSTWHSFYTEAAATAALALKQSLSEKGNANGYAGLDGSGKVPTAQLPSYVDDVIEAANFAALPGTGVTGVIYITIDTNKTYRWGGSSYIEIRDDHATWGAIDGTLSAQTDLAAALAAKEATANKGAANGYAPLGSDSKVPVANMVGIPTFRQQTDPALSTPYQWWETNPDGSLKTLWIKTS